MAELLSTKGSSYTGIQYTSPLSSCPDTWTCQLMLLKSEDHPSSVVNSSTRRRTKAGVMGRRRVDLACSFDARRSANRGMAGLGIVRVVDAGSVGSLRVMVVAGVG